MSRAEVQRLDLGRAASVSADVARARSAEELEELLGRAADVLNSLGAVLWIGAGELLYPAASNGFDRSALAALGPLDHSVRNATVDCWSSGKVHTVPRTSSSNGAIVAPLFGDDRCIGVLALEVRDGRESDIAVQATAAMFAAQFSGIMPRWTTAVPGTADGESQSFGLDPAEHASVADVTVEPDTSAEHQLHAAVNS